MSTARARTASKTPAKKRKSSTTKKKSKPIVEELYFRSDSAYLCLIVNRRTRSMRVIDFRAGALPAKRIYIQSVARQEGIEKVITLVEKDEVSSWLRVGFVREGVIPGFYKRSDGHLCGCVIGDRTASVEISSGASKQADKVIAAAKKQAANIPEKIKGASFKSATKKDALAARDASFKKGEAFGVFDDFGRDAQRIYFDTSVRRSKLNYVSAEFQDCFGHSLIEILRVPQSENEILAVVNSLRNIGEILMERGIVAGFCFAPLENLELATAFIAAGYRKTGLVARGTLVGGERQDAILWTRKFANPADEEVE